MNERPDLDVLITEWLHSEAMGQAPDRMFERAFATMATTRQVRARRAFGLRTHEGPARLVLLFAAAALACAVVAGALVAGARLLSERRSGLESAPPRIASGTTFATTCPHPVRLLRIGSGIWVECPDQVRRLDTVTGSVTGVLPASAFAAEDGDAWVARSTVVDVIDSTTLAKRASTPVTDVVAIGLDGTSAWLARAAERELVRVDRSSMAIGPTIALPDTPSAIALGGGSVWVLLPSAGRVVRIDIATDAITALVAVESPAAITFAGSAVWVLDRRASAVTEIDPVANESRSRAFLPSAASPGSSSPFPPGAPSPPGGIVPTGATLWEVGGTAAIEVDPATGDVLRWLRIGEPQRVELTGIAVLDQGLVVLDGGNDRVLTVHP